MTRGRKAGGEVSYSSKNSLILLRTCAFVLALGGAQSMMCNFLSYSSCRVYTDADPSMCVCS